eukprot:SM000043S15880  [mRNA]  locus=s43:700776:702140:- [translate_table: standard]
MRASPVELWRSASAELVLRCQRKAAAALLSHGGGAQPGSGGPGGDDGRAASGSTASSNHRASPSAVNSGGRGWRGSPAAEEACSTELSGEVLEEGAARLMEADEKAGLHADLIYYLRFKQVRPKSGGAAVTRYAPILLEDLVVHVADGATAAYLDHVALGNEDDDGGGPPRHLQPELSSTRALERFRNKVALRRWLHRNFASVAAMYEDRHDLWTIATAGRNLPPPLQRPRASVTCAGIARLLAWAWWRKRRRQEAPPTSAPLPLAGLVLTCVCMPARRSAELGALRGWRLAYSLALELADVAAPVGNTLLAALGGALSFLLSALIGRSLGLVYRGICRSMRPNTNPHPSSASHSHELDI